MFNKEDYEHAKINGLADRFRGDEISRRIGLEIPLSDQIAILADRDIKPDKFARYLSIRARVISEVDAIIKGWEDSK
jgi:hypothetical protein